MLDKLSVAFLIRLSIYGPEACLMVTDSSCQISFVCRQET